MRGDLTNEHDIGLADAQLMEGLARGETALLEPLYLRHGDPVLRFLRSVLIGVSIADAEDLCQEVFLTVYKKAPRYRETGKLRSWLFGIAVRKARSWQRRQRFRRRALREWAAVEPGWLGSGESSPDLTVERRREITAALGRLPRSQREVLVMKMVEGMSGDEIAAALGISPNAVYLRTFRAQQTLSEELGAEPVDGGAKKTNEVRS